MNLGKAQDCALLFTHRYLYLHDFGWPKNVARQSG